MAYRAPVDQIRFILANVVPFDAVAATEAYAEATPDMVDAILNLKVMAGGSVNGEDVTPRADVNGDGSLGMPETLYIMKELSN